MFRRLFLIGVGLTFLAGCAPIEPGQGYEVTAIAFPDGHAQAGREVFLEMGCASCHRATWDEELPEPVAANPGPALGAKLALMQPGAVATAVILPTQHIDAQFGEGLSPMGDFTETMTVRELIDLVAYLREGSATVAETRGAPNRG